MARRTFRFGKFGRREKVWTILFAVVIVWVTGYRRVLRPRADLVKNTKASALRLENELVRLQAQRPDVDERRKHVETVREQMAGMYHELERLEEGLLNRQDLDKLLDQVVVKRGRWQVQINAVKPLKDEPRTGKDKDRPELTFYKRLFVQVDSYAPFDDLIAYVQALETQGPYQRVRGIVVKVEGQDVVRPRALILAETLLADTPEQMAKRRTEVLGTAEEMAERQTRTAKDPFLAGEKPKEEQMAVGLELSGIFGEGKALIALINGDPYKVGELIQGKRIVAINKDHVVLEQGSRRFLLAPQRGAE